MSLVGLCGFCLVLIFLVKLLEKQNASAAVGVAVLGCGLLLAASLSRVVPILDELEALVKGDESLSRDLALAVKGLGISYISGFASSVCRDNGEGSLSHTIEWISKITLVGLFLPLLLELLNTTVGWMGG